MSRPFIPKEHGAWAMLVVPWLIGARRSGFAPIGLQLALFAAALLTYMSLSAGLAYLRPAPSRRARALIGWAVVYAGLSLVPSTLLVRHQPMLLGFALLLAPVLISEVVHLRWKRERALINGALSIFGFSLLLPVSLALRPAPASEAGQPHAPLDGPLDGPLPAQVGESLPAQRGGPDELALNATIWLLVLAFFVGSLLFVKSNLRGRHDIVLRRACLLYHLLVPVAFVATGGPARSLALALLPSLVRTAVLAHPRPPAMLVGVTEIVTTLLFTALVLGLAPAV